MTGGLTREERESAYTAGGIQPGTGPLSAVCRTVSDPPPLYSSAERLSHGGLAGVAHLGACRDQQAMESSPPRTEERQRQNHHDEN